MLFIRVDFDMTDMIFSFDTEDFTSSREADGILYEANLFKEEGVKGMIYEFGISSVNNFGSNMFSKAITRNWFGIR